MKSILAFCAVGAVVCQQPAPAPAPATTAPPTTVAAATTVAPTTTYSFNITASATLGNINTFTNVAALLTAIQSGIQSASGGSVASQITSVQVLSSFGNLPSASTNNKVITAYANMTNVNTSTVTANGASFSGGRRLQTTTADIVATVANTGSDVVLAAQSIVSSTTLSGLASALVAVDPTTYAGIASNLTLTSAAAAKVQITSTVTGATLSSLTTEALQTTLNTTLPGGATVSDVVLSLPGGTTVTNAPNSHSSYAPIVAPMMSIWAAVYALIIS